ncbi:MAG: outer membrane lipoprotein-sorting protein [Kiritimatiellia bacterium]
MKLSALSAVFFCTALAAGGQNAQTYAVESAELPIGASARPLLDAVLANLPREPLMIRGDAIVRRQKGLVVTQFAFEMLLQWGAEPVEARYTLFDPLGRTLEQLTISRPRGQSPRFVYARGDPLVPADLPDLYSAVQGSDFSWMDLSLSFLWWPEGTVIGKEEVRGRECYLVELNNPEDSSAGSNQEQARVVRPGYVRVVLWVDCQFAMLLQAEGYDAAGKPVRCLWVKSLKKVEERWMVKDMEVQQFPPVHRTRLYVRDVEPVP